MRGRSSRGLSPGLLLSPFDSARGAEHPVDIIRRDFTCLTLDLAQMGVGGDDSWGALVHPEYTLPAKAYSYSFRVRPLLEGDDPAVLASRMR